MSAAFDLEIFQIFMAECSATNFESKTKQDEMVRGSLLYICSAFANGNYCDFDFILEEDIDKLNPYYASTRKYLDSLQCRPLLQPWLEERNWSEQQVVILKATHTVTLALRK